MTSAYEWIITTRSFHRTRTELSSAALSLTLIAEQNIRIIQIVRKIVLKKKYAFPDFNNIPAKAEILKTRRKNSRNQQEIQMYFNGVKLKHLAQGTEQKKVLSFCRVTYNKTGRG